MRRILVLLILSLAIILTGCHSQTPKATEIPLYREVKQPILWTPVYNDHECGLLVSRGLPEGATQRDLTCEEIAGLAPETILADLETTGYARFLQDGSLFYAVLQMKLGENSATVSLGQAADWNACCMSLCAQDGEVSACGETVYRLYCVEHPNEKSFIAYGQLNGEPILVRIDTKNPEQVRGIFENILKDFAYYRGNNLNLNTLKAN